MVEAEQEFQEPLKVQVGLVEVVSVNHQILVQVQVGLTLAVVVAEVMVVVIQVQLVVQEELS